jgi:cysteine desulfurase family protein (TIGR01976 family)
MAKQPSFTKHFPALKDGFSFLDNAAGAQVPKQCIGAISTFLSTGSANVGAPYKASQTASTIKAESRKQTADFLGCKAGEVAIGPTSTALTFHLSRAFSRLWGKGDEVVISELEHEANASPWRELKAAGVTIKVWPVRPDTLRLEPADLKKLVTKKTKLVAVTAAANSIGSTSDIAAAAEIAKGVGAWCIADMVHYSPHHLPDVKGWGLDFAVFSAYKVFGPHMAFMYVREGLLQNLPTDKLFFIPPTSLLKFEPGTNNHECLAGWLGSLAYIRDVLGEGKRGRAGFKAAYKQIEAIEKPLVEYGLEQLLSIPKVQLHGRKTPDGRVGTFCFNVKGYSPMQVGTKLGKAGVGVAVGDFYAPMPLKALGVKEAIRASVLHYSTKNDLDKMLEVLKNL